MTQQQSDVNPATADFNHEYTIVGRKANRTVTSDNGFTIIQAGDVINKDVVERAIRTGRYFELTRSAARV